jgi:hypothetical protein
VVITSDAMQAQQKAARFLTQEKGADYFFTLKGNQPSVQEKALQLLGSAFPPSSPGAGSDGREGARAIGAPGAVGAAYQP